MAGETRQGRRHYLDAWERIVSGRAPACALLAGTAWNHAIDPPQTFMRLAMRQRRARRLARGRPPYARVMAELESLRAWEAR